MLRLEIIDAAFGQPPQLVGGFGGLGGTGFYLRLCFGKNFLKQILGNAGIAFLQGLAGLLHFFRSQFPCKPLQSLVCFIQFGFFSFQGRLEIGHLLIDTIKGSFENPPFFYFAAF